MMIGLGSKLSFSLLLHTLMVLYWHSECWRPTGFMIQAIFCGEGVLMTGTIQLPCSLSKSKSCIWGQVHVVWRSVCIRWLCRLSVVWKKINLGMLKEKFSFGTLWLLVLMQVTCSHWKPSIMTCSHWKPSIMACSLLYVDIMEGVCQTGYLHWLLEAESSIIVALGMTVIVFFTSWQPKRGLCCFGSEKLLMVDGLVLCYMLLCNALLSASMLYHYHCTLQSVTLSCFVYMVVVCFLFVFYFQFRIILLSVWLNPYIYGL